MILERIAIDFRCCGCHNVGRVEADLGKIVADQLPAGWMLETLGPTCGRCAETSEVSTAKHRADDRRRENIRKLQTAEVTSLESPTTTAVSPLVSDKCTRCNMTIGEMESWRPDPLVNNFAKAHRICLDNNVLKAGGR